MNFISPYNRVNKEFFFSTVRFILLQRGQRFGSKLDELQTERKCWRQFLCWIQINAFLHNKIRMPRWWRLWGDWQPLEVRHLLTPHPPLTLTQIHQSWGLQQENWADEAVSRRTGLILTFPGFTRPCCSSLGVLDMLTSYLMTTVNCARSC